MKYRSGNNKQVKDALKHKEHKIKIGSAGLEENCSVQDKDQGKAKGNQGPPSTLWEIYLNDNNPCLKGFSRQSS